MPGAALDSHPDFCALRIRRDVGVTSVGMRRLVTRRKDGRLPSLAPPAAGVRAPFAADDRAHPIIVNYVANLPWIAPYASFQEDFLKSAHAQHCKGDPYR